MGMSCLPLHITTLLTAGSNHSDTGLSRDRIYSRVASRSRVKLNAKGLVNVCPRSHLTKTAFVGPLRVETGLTVTGRLRPEAVS